jgi:hypothetical protein
MSKKCPQCRAIKTDEDFYRRSDAKDGLATYCKQCDRQRNKAWRLRDPRKTKRLAALKRARMTAEQKAIGARRSKLKYKYGLSLEDFQRAFDDQRGLCAMCRKPMSRQWRRKDTCVVDHCHRTERVRGLIHSGCNMVLGAAADDIEILLAAVRYLQATGNGLHNGERQPVACRPSETGSPATH